MEEKERVALTLKGGVADRVPRGELVIDNKFIEKFTGRGPVTLKEELSFYEDSGLDLACFNREEALAYFKGSSSLFLFGLVNGGLGEAVELLGFSQAMLKLATNPADVRELIKSSCLKNAEKGKKLVAAGAGAIIIGDDIAYNHGTYTSPRTLREVLFPCLETQVAELQREGVPVFFHSDGNYMTVLNDLAACGFSGLQCLEENAGMDVAALKKKIPPPFCLMGGLDLYHLDPAVPAARLEEKVASLMEKGKMGGCYIFGTNGGLAANLDPVAVARMFKYSDRYAKY